LQQFESSSFFDELPQIVDIEEALQHPVVLEPGEHSPETGERLLAAFLSGLKPTLRREVLEFLTATKAASLGYNKRMSRLRRRDALNDIWLPWKEKEQLLYEEIKDGRPFIEKTKAGYGMKPESCKYISPFFKLTKDHQGTHTASYMSSLTVLRTMITPTLTPHHHHSIPEINRQTVF
jgi:hypothetical protein